MSKYGIDYYGTAYYGANTSVEFTAAGFVANSYAYNKIQLSWATPSGPWDYIRLVRSQYGFPVSADDGDLLLEQTNPGPTLYIDVGQSPNNVGLSSGQPYYYTLFVRETTHNSWQTAGNALGISVKDYGTTQTMYDYLPKILTSNIPYDTSLETNNDFLFRFLKLFAFNMDLWKTQAENISNRYDVTKIDGRLIPTFMEKFGLTYEPNIGLKQSRILLRNIALLYQNKGTKAGTNEFIKAYAGYDNKLVMGKNLMLDQNDSSFEQSIGSWASISNATLAQHLATDSPTITPYKELFSNPDFFNSQKATLKVTAVATAAIEIALSGTTPTHYGIPVAPSTAYTFSGYAQAGGTAKNVSAQIFWYDSKGSALTPSTTGSSVSNTAGSWHQFVSSVTSPAAAAYAVPHIKISSTTAGDAHYFDALQFEAGSSATYFQDARQIEITLIANRINEIINPNFEETTAHWTVTNGTKSLTTSESESVEASGSVAISGGAMELYASAAGLVTLTSDAMNVFANNDYTFSIYCSASELVGDSKVVTPYVSWYDSTSTLLLTTIGTPVSVGNTFLRPFVTDIAPSTAVTAKVGITWVATGAGGELTGNEITVDAALFEKSSFVNAYFDGSNGVAQLSDLFWEGTINASRSHYYRNRFSVESRLKAKLPDWITYGSTFELLLAQPGT